MPDLRSRTERLCRRGKRSPSPAGVILTLVTRDVDGWHQRLRARGASFEAPPEGNPALGIYHCFLKDPEGYLVEIQRFDSRDWPAPAQGPLCSTST